MRRSATTRFLVSISLATLLGGTALADPAVDRLFVLVSPPDIAGPSAIVAFDVGSDGVPVQAESYSTGGTGRGQNSPQGVVTDAGGRFLFAANNESHDIAVFAVRPDGTLAAVEGSPFAVGVGPSTYSPVYLAVTPDASFLYAAAQGALVAFEIGDAGALDPIQSLPGTMAEIVTSPVGDYLYAAGISPKPSMPTESLRRANSRNSATPRSPTTPIARTRWSSPPMDSGCGFSTSIPASPPSTSAATGLYTFPGRRRPGPSLLRWRQRRTMRSFTLLPPSNQRCSAS